MIQTSTDSCENVPEIFGIPSLIVSHGSIFCREIPTESDQVSTKGDSLTNHSGQGLGIGKVQNKHAGVEIVHVYPKETSSQASELR